MRVYSISFVAYLLIACQSCSSALSTIPANELASLAAEVSIAGVPFIEQGDYQCGPAALAMVFNWSGTKITLDELLEKTFTPGRRGSFQSDLITATRRHGKLAYVIEPRLGALLRELESGHPVVVLQNRGLNWIPLWHYAVVTGYNIPEQSISLVSGRYKKEFLSMEVFAKTWDRANNWGLLVLPPATIPKTADPVQLLSAIVGLERAEKWNAAEKAYTAYLSIWPQSIPAHVGLSNALLNEGKLQEATANIEKGLKLNPNSEVLLNNYALLLLQFNRKQEALKIAKLAVSKKGHYHEECLKTLAQIKANVLKK